MMTSSYKWIYHKLQLLRKKYPTRNKILPKLYSTLTFEFAKQHLINIQYSLIKNLNLTTKHSVIPRQETKHGLCSSCLACLVRRTLTKLTNNERSFIAITSFSTNEDVRIKFTSYHHINMLLLCTHSSCRYDIHFIFCYG